MRLHAKNLVKSPISGYKAFFFWRVISFLFSQPVGLVELAAEQRFCAAVRWSVAEPSVKQHYASVASDFKKGGVDAA